jgi:hypothetical protein
MKKSDKINEKKALLVMLLVSAGVFVTEGAEVYAETLAEEEVVQLIDALSAQPEGSQGVFATTTRKD